VSAAVFFAWRRVRARPLSALGITLAFAAATALLGWSSLTAARSQETSVRQALTKPQTRPLQVVYFTLPLESDFRAREVNSTFAQFADTTLPARRLRVSHSIVENEPLGTRLVTAREPRADVLVRFGRLPASCHATNCEMLALRGTAHLGERISLGNGVRAVVVGVGSIRAQLLPDASELGRRAFFLRSLPAPLAALVSKAGSTVVTTARLDPRRTHGYDLAEQTSRLRAAITHLQFGDPLVRGSAPFGLLRDLSHRGKVARERVLLIAGEAAALILAFAAFLAAARRREAELVDDQLAVLGGSRRQYWIERVTEIAVPAVLGVGTAFVALVIAAALALTVGAGLPVETIATIFTVAIGGSVLLVAVQAPRSAARVGVLDVAAVCALALLVWEAASTGALDPDRVAASGAAPVLLLGPALGFFAVAVVLLRVVPPALRAAARATRTARPAVSLAFLTAARNPVQVAATTTFLAVALGASLFSLDYRATLDQQAKDHGDFVVGAPWRLDAFAGAGAPLLRLDGRVEDAAARLSPVPATVLGAPASSIPRLRGWRGNFSSLSLEQIARRVRPRPVAMRGLPLARDAREVRVWARGRTDYARRLVLHVLQPDQTFAHVVVGFISRRRSLLHVRLPASASGGQIVAVAFQPTYVPLSFKYEPTGFVELGPLEERTADGWTKLPSLSTWIPSTAPTGTAGVLVPAGSGIRFDLLGTLQPLIHPRFGLPDVRSGFVSGEVPALASGPLARRAVDGLLVLDLEGIQLPVRVVGEARLFPTVTERPSSFLVFDYDTLFATLNADQPGRDVPSGALFFGRGPPAGPGVLSATGLTHALESDPLAAGMRDVLGVAGVVAALLGLIGLALATRSALASERLQLAEYEALGVPPTSLRRSAQARLFVLSAFGLAAAIIGAVLSGRLIAAFVAVTGTARKPLPPILPIVDWAMLVLVVLGVAVAGGVSALLLTRRALRDVPAHRLRA
jgi:hypothetical protein